MAELAVRSPRRSTGRRGGWRLPSGALGGEVLVHRGRGERLPAERWVGSVMCRQPYESQASHCPTLPAWISTTSPTDSDRFCSSRYTQAARKVVSPSALARS